MGRVFLREQEQCVAHGGPSLENSRGLLTVVRRTCRALTFPIVPPIGNRVTVGLG